MKKALRWVVVSLALQLLLMAFLDSFYMNWRRGGIKLFKLEEAELPVEEYALELPDGTSRFRISFDSRFIACLIGGTVRVLDYTGKELVLLGSEEESIGVFTWLPDRNILLYALESDRGSTVKIETYEAPEGVFRSYPPITGLPEGSRVAEIHPAVMTRHVYVRVAADKNEDTIFRYNLLENLEEYIRLAPGKDFLPFRLRQGIAYEGSSESLVIKQDGAEERAVKLDSSFKILGTDRSDNILILKKAGTEGVSELGFLHLDDDSLEFRPIKKLSSRIKDGQVIFTQSGQIYVLDAENRFVNIGTGAVTAFEGKLAAILEGRYAVLQDGVLRVKKIG